MATGCVLFTGAFVLLATVAAVTGAGGRAHWAWTVLAIALMTLGELHLAPTSWSMFSRLAPPGREALLTGLGMLPLFAGSYLAGLSGIPWGAMPHHSFFPPHRTASGGARVCAAGISLVAA